MSGLPIRSLASSGLIALALSLGACSGLVTPHSGASQQLSLDGQNYRVEQITASTWTATPLAGPTDPKPQAASLVQAIEKASGCKVSDSSFSQQGAVLSAQVDCGGSLKTR